MASKIEAVLDALVTRFQVANGIGSYHYDLSATDVVQIGRPEHLAPVAPRVWLEDWDIQVRGIGQGLSGGAEATAEEARLQVDVLGYVAVTDATRRTRSVAASRLLSDLHRALAASRRLGGTVIYAQMDGAELDPRTLGLLGDYAAVVVELQCVWNTRGGL